MATVPPGLDTPKNPHVILRKTGQVSNHNTGGPPIGYDQCGDPGGYVGAKIAYGRIPKLEDFH